MVRIPETANQVSIDIGGADAIAGTADSTLEASIADGQRR